MDLGLRDQHYISQQRRLPTDDLGSDKGVTAPSETVQLYYYNAGTLTSDAGQAAGTVCVGKFAYRNIRNAIGDVVGTFLDTSMAFTSTAFTTEKAFPLDVAEKNDQLTGTTKAVAITSGYSNGDYCIDYRTGAVYGIKASTQTSLTSCTYKIETSTSITPGIFTASNDITHIGGVAVSAKNVGAGEPPFLGGYEFEAIGALTADGGTAGDKVPFKGSAKGVLYVQNINGDGELGSAPQAYGVDVAGADAYTTVVTASKDCSHISISLQGAHDAIVSLDGSIDAFYIPAGSAHVFDGVVIQTSGTVQGKNATGGSNYASLAISIW